MKEHPTLLDALLVECNNPAYDRLDFDVRALQKALISARRFVLDDEMSAFTTDLAYAPLEKYDQAGAIAAMDDLRRLSRLPHSSMWIELNMRRRCERARAYGIEHRAEGPHRIGWLLMQHPQIETAFMALHCVSDTIVGGDYENLKPVASAATFGYQWRADDDGPLAWLPLKLIDHPESTLTGFMGYKSDFAGLVETPFLKRGKKLLDAVPFVHLRSHVNELAGDLRYLWALLAAINDVPVGYETVRPSKGYVSRGVYRKYLEHSVIHLKVPHRVSIKVLATQVMGIARRRAHQVRGHWRRNHKKPGERMWVREHVRGDDRLGFVTHDYQVEHERPEK